LPLKVSQSIQEEAQPQKDSLDKGIQEGSWKRTYNGLSRPVYLAVVTDQMVFYSITEELCA